MGHIAERTRGPTVDRPRAIHGGHSPPSSAGVPMSDEATEVRRALQESLDRREQGSND